VFRWSLTKITTYSVDLLIAWRALIAQKWLPSTWSKSAPIKSLSRIKIAVMRTKEVKPWSQYWLIAAGAYPSFYSMKRLGVFLLPLDGMLVHRRSLPRNLLGFPNNSQVPIYTPGWREAPWELIVLPKNTTQCPLARARTRTARSGDERTNHESTAPPPHMLKLGNKHRVFDENENAVFIS